MLKIPKLFVETALARNGEDGRMWVNTLPNLIQSLCQEWRLDLLVETAELNPRLARAWTLVRCVDYWLWGLGVGLTIDPPRCKHVVNWLIESSKD